MAAGDVRRAQSSVETQEESYRNGFEAVERCEKRVGGHNPPIFTAFRSTVTRMRGTRYARLENKWNRPWW